MDTKRKSYLQYSMKISHQPLPEKAMLVQPHGWETPHYLTTVILCEPLPAFCHTHTHTLSSAGSCCFVSLELKGSVVSITTSLPTTHLWLPALDRLWARAVADHCLPISRRWLLKGQGLEEKSLLLLEKCE